MPAVKRRPRGSLTRELILDAAEQVAADGPEALSVRAVAAEAGAAPMALYNHFPTKDALLAALLDRVLGRVDGGPATADWAADLHAFALAHRRVLAAHPWAVMPLFTHAAPGPNATRVGEDCFAILRRGGITGEAAVAAFSGIIALNYGWSAFTTARPDGDSLADDLAAPPPCPPSTSRSPSSWPGRSPGTAASATTSWRSPPSSPASAGADDPHRPARSQPRRAWREAGAWPAGDRRR